MANYSRMRRQIEEMQAEREAWTTRMGQLDHAQNHKRSAQNSRVIKLRHWLSQLVTKVRNKLPKG